MPKVIVCGRGGSGKSTLVSLLSVELALSIPVLVIDADESNMGLNVMLGLEPPAETVMDFLGGKPTVRGKLLATLRGDEKAISLFEEPLSATDLPREISSGNGRLKLVRVGKIEHSMEGCACPMGAVARSFLNHLELEGDQWVLVDTEAGIEHFGRGLLEGADYILVAVEPSLESVALAGKACRLAREAGKGFGVVLSRVDDESRPLIEEKLFENGLSPIGSVPRSSAIARANLEGSALEAASAGGSLEGIIAAVRLAIKDREVRAT